jgi:hypothetical protein
LIAALLTQVFDGRNNGEPIGRRKFKRERTVTAKMIDICEQSDQLWGQGLARVGDGLLADRSGGGAQSQEFEDE